MLLRKRSFAFMISIAIILVVGMIIRKCYVAMKRADTYGTVASVCAALYTETQSNLLLIEDFNDGNEKEWNLLSEKAYDDVIMSISSKNLDARVDREQHMPLKDMWGKRFAIFHRRFSKKLDFIVVSAGPDGVYGTADDVASADTGAVLKWD